MKSLGKSRLWFGVSIGLALLGCQGEDVALGEEGSAIQLNRCYGSATDCGGLGSSVLPEPRVRSCSATPAAELEADFFVDLSIDGPIGCGSYVNAMKLADDDSVWLLGNTHCDYSMTLWLRHYSNDGTLLGQNDLVGNFDVQKSVRAVDLAIDERNHAWLALATTELDGSDKDRFHDEFTVVEFDSQAMPEGSPFSVAGLGSTQIHIGAGRRITIAGNASQNEPRGIIARLSANGEPSWIRNDIPSEGQGSGYGLTDLFVDSDGHATTLSVRARNYELDRQQLGLTRVDGAGNALWDHVLPMAFAGGTAAMIAGDLAGNLVIAGELGANAGMIQKIAADGVPSWAFETQGASTFSLDSVSGRVAFGDRGVLYVIPADGAECVPHATGRLDGVPWLFPYVAQGKSGKIFLGDGYGFGRYTLPESE